jgi:hypothetical protein
MKTKNNLGWQKVVAAFAVATVLTSIAWSAIHREFLPSWLYGIGMVILFPGGVLAALFAMVFTDTGIHGEAFYWMIPPANWAFYFALTLLFLKNRPFRR